MARARNIKPGFFKNEFLAMLPAHARLLFQGLWLMADRDGRLEDRPLRIKAEIFPFEDIDVDSLLKALSENEEAFIIRYSVKNKKYIQISNFHKHQNPHKNEAPSEIPGLSDFGASESVHYPSGSDFGEATRADSPLLIPDSPLLIPPPPSPQPELVKRGEGKFFEIENGGETVREDEWIVRSLIEHRRSKQLSNLGLESLESLYTLYPSTGAEARQWLMQPIERRIAAYALMATESHPNNEFKYAHGILKRGGKDFQDAVENFIEPVKKGDFKVKILPRVRNRV